LGVKAAAVKQAAAALKQASSVKARSCVKAHGVKQEKMTVKQY